MSNPTFSTSADLGSEGAETGRVAGGTPTRRECWPSSTRMHMLPGRLCEPREQLLQVWAARSEHEIGRCYLRASGWARGVPADTTRETAYEKKQKKLSDRLISRPCRLIEVDYYAPIDRSH